MSLPMSTAQARFWRHELLSERTGANNSLAMLSFTGELNVARLDAAVCSLIDRHEILRTRFERRGDGGIQCVEPSSARGIAFIDLLGVSGYDACVRKLRSQLLRRPIDLTRPPLFHLVLVRTEPDTHFLLFLIHHIISDGWSQDLFMDELVATYLAGPSSQVAGPVPQYSQFVREELQHLSSPQFARERAWWQHYLQNAVPTALSRELAGVPGETGNKHFFQIDAGTTRGLIALGSRNRASLANVLLSGLLQTLYERTGQPDCLIGLMSGVRTSAAFERTLGCMLNIVCLRAQMGTRAVDELTRSVRDAYLDVTERAQFPFEHAISMLPPRVGGPLEIVYVAQSPRNGGLSVPGLRVQVIESMEHVPAFPLVVMSTYTGHEVSFSLEYDTALFRAEEIEALAEHLAWTLSGFATARSADTDDIGRAFIEAQLRHIGEGKLEAAAWEGRSVHGLFEEQAALHANVTAIVGPSGFLTYGALNVWASRIGQRLLPLTSAPESVVALACSRSPAAMAAWLGILKAGAVVLPVDPGESLQEIDRRLTNARACALLIDTEFEEAARQLQGALPVIDVTALGGEAISVGSSAAVDPHSAAYICFTSGSTGVPGTVLGTHAATVNRLVWLHRQRPIRIHERCLVRTPVAFVDCIAEIFGPLTAGGTLVLCPEACSHDPERLAAMIQEYGVQRVTLVPTLLRSLLPEITDLPLDEPLTWHVSGEPFPGDLLRMFRRIRPCDVLLNLYGSAEVAADVSCADLSQCDPDVPHVGTPAANCRILVLDSKLRPTPPWVEGEVFIAGVPLSRGYLNDPGRTASHFMPSTDGMGERMYRTGDRGLWLRDGNLRLVARQDRQIKRRGVRIALDGIERRLESMPTVEASAVFWQRATQSIIAVVTLRSTTHIVWNHDTTDPDSCRVARLTLEQEQGLWSEIVGRLPVTALPDTVFVVDRLPRTPSGKIRRALLEAIPWSAIRAQRDERFAAPATSTEQALIDICERILRSSGVRPTDRFLAIGMGSMQLVQVLHAVAETFNVRLKLSQLYSATSLRKCAQLIDAEIATLADRSNALIAGELRHHEMSLS